MIPAPARFSGTLQQLFDEYVSKLLPTVRTVEHLHDMIQRYCELDGVVYLLRQVSGTNRGQTYRTNTGARFRATDNAPAWWMYGRLAAEWTPSLSEFSDEMSRVPAKMFDVTSPASKLINSNRWHVAHIYNVKDGDTTYQKWSRLELARRFARNVHPCNQFYIPIADWQRYGEATEVKGFFIEQYRRRYSAIWPAFLALIDGADPPWESRFGSYHLDIADRKAPNAAEPMRVPQRFKVGAARQAPNDGPLDGLDGRRHYNQRDMMRELNRLHCGNVYKICDAYAAAEARGLVERESNLNAITAYEYAQYLYLDGRKKGWL